MRYTHIKELPFYSDGISDLINNCDDKTTYLKVIFNIENQLFIEKLEKNSYLKNIKITFLMSVLGKFKTEIYQEVTGLNTYYSKRGRINFQIKLNRAIQDADGTMFNTWQVHLEKVLPGFSDSVSGELSKLLI